MLPRLLGEAVAGAGYCVIDEPPRCVVLANGPLLVVPGGWESSADLDCWGVWPFGALVQRS
jgi:hypothetical protein